MVWRNGPGLVVSNICIVHLPFISSLANSFSFYHYFIFHHLSSPEDQLSRMLARDGPNGLTESDAKSRLASQQDLASKKPFADVILDNSVSMDSSSSGSSEALKAQVSELVRRWKSQSQGLGWLLYVTEWSVPPFGLLMGLITVARRRSKVAERRSKL